MTPKSEVASALAVRCLFTANHVRSFLGRDQDVTESVRRDLAAAAELLESVSSGIEKNQHAY